MTQAEMVLSGKLWTLIGFMPGRIVVKGRQIAAVEYGEFEPEPNELALGEAFITPGLIDLQLNGGLGFDFTQQPDTLDPVAAALPRWGVTSFLPTYITAPLETYYNAVERLVKRPADAPGARVLGAHFEGPYLSSRYIGAHEPAYIRKLNLAEIKEFVARIKEQLGSEYKLMITLAPDGPGAPEVVHLLKQNNVLVSAGHSSATYEEGMAAFEAGATCGTHLFNAMPPLHHRKPGLVGALLEHPAATANLIVDGIHLHPAMVKLIYRLKGWERVVLVTDAMAGMGMPPGRYDLAGQSVIVDESSARLADAPDTLAGSILTLDAALRNMLEFTACPPHEVVAMATLNPARLLGVDNRKGQLAPGYDADIAVFSPDFGPLMTIVEGQIAFQRDLSLA